jgi:cell division protein FtsZ
VSPGITDLITTPGLINLDFADVKSVMSNAGSALMGIGSARGENRAVEAAELAVSSPLLEESIDGAQGVLLSIAGGSDLGLFEINEAAAMVSEAVTPTPTSSSVPPLTTHSATRSGSRSSPPGSRVVGRSVARGPVLRPRPAQTQKPQTQEETRAAARALASSAGSRARRGAASGAGHCRRPALGRNRDGPAGTGAGPPARSQPTFDDDELDVPDFLK